MKKNTRIIFTDLDGTLLNSDRKLSRINRTQLEELKNKNIIRVIATGRSLFSYKKLLAESIPADYLIFSTGAGIIDLSSNTLLFSTNIGKKDIFSISEYLTNQRVDFMVHHPVPDNHRFVYWGDSSKNSDFKHRIKVYQKYAEKFTGPESLPDKSAQIVAIFPEDLQHFEKIGRGLTDFQITRTTSPFDGKSIWMEILPANVGKGTSASWLCNHLNINREETMGIGNDYNDISLLEYTKNSYIVANAPIEMHNSYKLTSSNNDDGFSHAIKDVLE